MRLCTAKITLVMIMAKRVIDIMSSRIVNPFLFLIDDIAIIELRDEEEWYK